jgi:hypothetical protein
VTGRFSINVAYEVEKIINLTSSSPDVTIMGMRLPFIGLVGVVGVVGRITGRVRSPYE